jgi:hypothetical protein
MRKLILFIFLVVLKPIFHNGIFFMENIFNAEWREAQFDTGSHD